MEEVVKVALLGCDLPLLKKICDRVNSDHPAEVFPFTELNEFLKFCMTEKPDILGVNVAFPHKSSANFPKIFKMAMSVPVFAFVEAFDSKNEKLLNSCKADHEIRGVISHLNLWMRIANIIKEQEEGPEENSSSMNSEGDKNNSIHLKGSSSEVYEAEQDLNSILKALGQEGSESDSEDIDQVDLNSTNNSSADNKLNLKDDPEDNRIKIDSRDVRSIKNLDKQENEDLNNRSLNQSKNQENDQVKRGTNTKVDPKNGEIGLMQDDSDQTNKLDQSEVNKNNPPLQLTPEEEKSLGLDTENKDNEGLGSLLAELEESSKEGGAKKNKKTDVDKKNSGPLESQDQSSDDEEEVNREKDKKENKNEDKEKNQFGNIKIADKKALDKEAREKEKEKNKKENIKKENILKSSCELGLQTAYLSQGTSTYQSFSVEYLSTFIVESGPFKGILVLATTAELGTEELVDDFRATVIENLKANNINCEISKEYPISMKVEKYQDVVKQFADFSINHSDDVGNQQNVIFVARESVRPSVSDSNLPDMLEVDIKVIPPQTPVNFDAFIHLPINKKFVRYLKDGRSLSLKQAKRHMEEEQNILYLPENQKDKFIAFFIKNTLNWDFTLHSNKIKDAS